MVIAAGGVLALGVGVYLVNRSKQNEKKRGKLNHIHDAPKPDAKGPVPPIVTRDQWLIARKRLLDQEKELTRHRDEVTQARQQMPWVKLTKDYVLRSVDGSVVRFSDLFVGRKDLVVWHYMFDPSWPKACATCSSWIDGFNGQIKHIRSKANIAVIGKAGWERMRDVKAEKKWEIPLLSSSECDFNADFGVEPPPNETKENKGKYYNYGTGWGAAGGVPQTPGFSVFRRCKDGSIYHTYSAYARGLENFNSILSVFDALPYGREGFAAKHEYPIVDDTCKKDKSSSSSSSSVKS